MLKNKICQILWKTKKINLKTYQESKEFKNIYTKDNNSYTQKVNRDMVKKVNTDDEMITCNECRYQCFKGKISKEAHNT